MTQFGPVIRLYDVCVCACVCFLSNYCSLGHFHIENKVFRIYYQFSVKKQEYVVPDISFILPENREMGNL